MIEPRPARLESRPETSDEELIRLRFEVAHLKRFVSRMQADMERIRDENLELKIASLTHMRTGREAPEVSNGGL